MYRYRFRLLLEPDPLDGRDFPSTGKCVSMLDGLLNLSSGELNGLSEGGWVEREMDADTVVRFHHERRATGCCPRVKWEVV